MAPVLESIAKEYDGKIVIYKIDVDKEKDLARAFNISSIPALLYIPAKSGEPVMKVGLKDADRIRSEIREVLNVK
jgi:thioredoxin-like negative regulator of GroEL